MQELENAIKSDNLIIFAGAGLSKRLGLPTWPKLVEIFLERLKQNQPQLSDLIPPLQSGILSPIEVLEKIETHRAGILEILSSEMKLKSDCDLSLHRSLFELSSRVITTNFDKAFEKADENAEYVPYQSEFKVSKLHKTERFIFKLHGCIDYPDDCILFKSQYESHYGKLNAPTFELEKLFSEKTILFLGVSLSDPYLNEVFELIKKIYKGYLNNHFIITTDQNFNHSHVTPIVVKNYEEAFVSKIDELKRLRIKPRSVEKEERHIIQILSPRPIDNYTFDFNAEKIFDPLKNYDVDVRFDILTIENLRSLDDYDYLLVLTNVSRNQILVEDEFLKSKYIGLRELEESVSSSCQGTFVVHYGNTPVNFGDLKMPVAFVKISDSKVKEVISGLIHKIFKKNDLSFLEKEQTVINESKFHLKPLRKGIYKKVIFEPSVSKFIDKKNVAKFIGRRTDIEILIRKLIELKYENRILTIKGSGGIGKTTIITKAAIELASRKYFLSGIEFVACHSITTFENFEFVLSQALSLSNNKNIHDQLAHVGRDKDRVVILDNFETLLHLKEKEQIINLISIVCDFVSLVVTTRQLIGLDYEDIFELRNFTTEEGVELFRSIYPNIDKDDEKLLRVEIVERLLNNNPLAIKLIAKGLPHGKRMQSLLDELEVNVFRDENLEAIFERPEDMNIEKSNSLYHSINYSYTKLNTQEKLAFEILSLFPDGIPLENFKAFVKASKKTTIPLGDKEIKSLDDKSLLENSNKFLKLQSIISRFSDHHFKVRDTELRRDLYTTALGYNHFFVRFLSNRNRFKVTSSLILLDLNTNNYLKCLEFLGECNTALIEKLDFIDDIGFLFKNTNQPHHFLRLVRQFLNQGELDEKSRLVLELLIQKISYWTLEFDDSFATIEKLFPVGNINMLDLSNGLDELTFFQVEPVYFCEGYILEIFKTIVSKDNASFYINNIIFQLGYLREADELAKADPDPNFFEFEIALACGRPDAKAARNYLSKIYKKENIEIVQMVYLLAKIGQASNDDIDKLVVSNPFTKGLSLLIKALTTNDVKSKTNYFKKALIGLEHIKYYYAEACYFYAEFLSQTHSPEFDAIWKQGKNTCQKHHFRFLDHRFETLVGKTEVYSQRESEFEIDQTTLQNFILKVKKQMGAAKKAV